MKRQSKIYQKIDDIPHIIEKKISIHTGYILPYRLKQQLRSTIYIQIWTNIHEPIKETLAMKLHEYNIKWWAEKTQKQIL